jgi:hypothetical protein
VLVQYADGAHPASDAHVVGQSVDDPLQRYVPQTTAGDVFAATHVPSSGDPSAAAQTSHGRSHAVLQQTPSLQNPVAQDAALVQACPMLSFVTITRSTRWLPRNGGAATSLS